MGPESSTMAQTATVHRVDTRVAKVKIILRETFEDSLDLLDYLLTVVDNKKKHRNNKTTKPNKKQDQEA